MKTDQELTAIYRRELKARGYTAPEYYEWHNGEPLYHGEPIQGRWTPQEAQAASCTVAIELASKHGVPLLLISGDTATQY